MLWSMGTRAIAWHSCTSSLKIAPTGLFSITGCRCEVIHCVKHTSILGLLPHRVSVFHARCVLVAPSSVQGATDDDLSEYMKAVGVLLF